MKVIKIAQEIQTDKETHTFTQKTLIRTQGPPKEGEIEYNF